MTVYAANIYCEKVLTIWLIYGWIIRFILKTFKIEYELKLCSTIYLLFSSIHLE